MDLNLRLKPGVSSLNALPKVPTLEINDALRFCFKMASEYLTAKSDKDPESNTAISAISVFLCLSLAKLGARTETLKKLEAVLGANYSDAESLTNKLISWSDSQFILKIANGLFITEDRPLSPEFLRIADKTFTAKVENLNFKTLKV